MPSFFLALIAALLAATGARDQRMVAALSASLGASRALLAMCWIASAATAALAAFAGGALAQVLPPAGKVMLVAIALLLAVAELAWPVPWREPREPTRSLFAIAFAIAARQVSDAARFLVVAIAASTGMPALAAVGGAMGGAAALTLGWALGAGLERFPLRAIRLAAAALLLVAAIATALSARGIV